MTMTADMTVSLCLVWYLMVVTSPLQGPLRDKVLLPAPAHILAGTTVHSSLIVLGFLEA